MQHIEKILVGSTSNITEETSKMLDFETNDVPVSYKKGEYGWLIVVMDDDEEIYPHTCPHELKTLMDYARSLQCDWLMLDRDADPLPDVPQFDW